MDGGNLFDDTTVVVTVNRNQFTPEWVQDNYQMTIPDSFFLSVPILSVSATDRDQTVSKTYLTHRYASFSYQNVGLN